MTPPTITIQEDLDLGYVIVATSYGRTEPAGERLFRAPPWPEIRFVHDTMGGAEKDAATLREYIATKWPKKAISKAAMKKKVEARA